ncbi:Putative hybrid two-component sensor-regulator tanscriptional histidine kinase fixJ (modular protein); putative signal transduction histidine kinase with CheB and CheR activity [Magnetospirillum molischianum DSM 120]|uniref:histidine kinase n=1 Tax=Magnetospirillum molischianum DSM 120 TaxID=1150626 RepID=H8FPD8_MAGML|nr:Putative hybrid two-component sensor-regulator tanscriptional histidine kinase fixJ (modular protein); putative signal transduction histidine kinase with CheB and CheR activity [Magnetospirillum molischianum DSM 120]
MAEPGLKGSGIEADLAIDDLLRVIHELRVRQIELEMQNESLREAHRLSESKLADYIDLYDASPIACLTLDNAGFIGRINAPAIALLHSVSGRAGTQRLANFVADESLLVLASFIDNIVIDSGIHSCEVALRPGDVCHEERFVQLSGRACATGQSCIIALVDITEYKRITDALLRAVEEAERASAAKSRFLTVASHDLRQPLQSLCLISWVMARKADDVQIRALLAEQEQALGTMSAMLNTLLDINLLDAGIISYNPIGLAVAPLLSRLGRDFAFQAGAANDVLHLVDSSLIVQSDPKLLEQILRNLLSNAFKYTHDGRVLLGCRRRGGHVRIEVWDNGIGIPEDQIDSIFEEFHQIDNPHRQHRHGFGLGLAIVKRQAALLGHSIGVRSRPGKGSVFWVELPMGDVVTAPSAPLSSQDNDLVTPFHHRSVLVVEDDPSVGAMLEQLFIAEGCTVIWARTGNEALTFADKAFDLVVTDYILPDGMTGLDVLSCLRTVIVTLPAILLADDIATDSLRQIVMEPDCTHLSKSAKMTEILSAAGGLLARSVCCSSSAVGRAVASTVYVIDDDPHVRKAIAALLHEEGHEVYLYPDAETFLRTHELGREGCLLVDAVMPGMGGLELLDHLRKQSDSIPAIVMTGHGDVPMAVAAMKAGAGDFIAKPINPEEMRAAVASALELGRDVAAESARRADAIRCFASLTPREHQVFERILTGMSNKVIAYEMGISRRTVENHRAAIMSKTASKSLLDLYRIARLFGA